MNLIPFYLFIHNLGVPEIFLILVIVLIIFGAGKLPEVGSSLGKAIKEFKKASKSTDSSKEEDVNKKEKN